jgi:hypothetical protein
VLVTRNGELVGSPELARHLTPWRADADYRPADFAWTDDYSSVFRVLK